MRLRADSLHIAGWKRSAALGARIPDPHDDVYMNADYAGIPPAEPGDVWILHNRNGEVVGYGLTCPNEACEQGAHPWDHARDCPVRTAPDAPPCWTWTGSIEDGSLTASPSLHVVKEWGGCGWHGWLRNGEMVPA
jgi:hypothetical protein